jgi:hypothetical protein
MRRDPFEIHPAVIGLVVRFARAARIQRGVQHERAVPRVHPAHGDHRQSGHQEAGDHADDEPSDEAPAPGFLHITFGRLS